MVAPGHPDYWYIRADKGPQGKSAPMSVTVKREGLWALAPNLREKVFVTMLRDAAKATLREWAQSTTLPGLQARMQPQWMQELQLTPRSSRYAARVERAWGMYYPYRSPTRATRHMGSMLKHEGEGWRVQSKNDTGLVAVTRLALPGTRALNALNRIIVHHSRRQHRPGAHQSQDRREAVGITDLSRYRAEFLRLDHPSNAKDRKFILERPEHHFRRLLDERRANPRRWRIAQSELS